MNHTPAFVWPGFEIQAQPDDVTCGPTALQAVYKFMGYDLQLQEVIDSVKQLSTGGTLSVLLGIDALKRGFQTNIYSYNLNLFDPTWKDLSNQDLVQKLEDQLTYKTGEKFSTASKAYQLYLELGGKLHFEDLDESLLHHFLNQKKPILTGLSATYLYANMRETETLQGKSIHDDLRGEPQGHFVVLCGIENGKVIVADPYGENPLSNHQYYQVPLRRLINSIMLGVITYDANLLIISKSPR